MHVLVTGHTGFKGAWLTLLLRELGHEVSGIALDPEAGSLFERAGLSGAMQADIRCDIRRQPFARHVADIAPDAVLHMAAQPLVRTSYEDPVTTVDTNVMGTLAVLHAVREVPSVRACLIVTTDKVYRNDGRRAGYSEGDALGGRDPYSASKAMADLLASSWASSFEGPAIGIARAGNVIGGGDVSRDRLMPDLLRAFEQGTPALIRYPEAVRPWQHVLDCLEGYRLLLEALVDGRGTGPWNFGPEPSGMRTVREVVELAASTWGEGALWGISGEVHPHEEPVLTLDASHARRELGWRDHLAFEEAVSWTIDWTRRVANGEDPRAVMDQQISSFMALARGAA